MSIAKPPWRTVFWPASFTLICICFESARGWNGCALGWGRGEEWPLSSFGTVNRLALFP